MSIAEVNAGQWVRCADLGWPLDKLGPDAEVWVDPLPSERYKEAVAKASRQVKHPRDSPRFYEALENEGLPWIYAAAVMTQMRGVKLTPDGDVLEDTQANRRAVLTTCPLLAERIYRFATRGPAGIGDLAWRDVAVQQRGALREVLGLIAAAGQGADAGELLAAIRTVTAAAVEIKEP